MEEKTTENLEIFYDPSINIQIDSSFKQTLKKAEPQNNSFKSPKNKKNNLIILIILIAIILSVISVSYAMMNNKENQQQDEPAVNNEITKVPDLIPNVKEDNYETIKLADLNRAFNNLSVIKKYNTAEGYSLSSTVHNNTFAIIIKTDTETTISFELKDNILTRTTTNDDMTSVMMFLYLGCAKAVLDGFDETETLSVLSDSSASTMTLEKNGSEITNTNEKMTLQLALNKKTVLLNLQQRYVTEKDLELFGEILKGTGSINGHSGLIYYYYSYHLNISEMPAQATLLIAEPKNFTSLTYNSLLTFIKVIYDKTEMNNFRSLYPSIKEGTFDKYTMSINPVNEDYNSYYDKDYAVLEIKFVK